MCQISLKRELQSAFHQTRLDQATVLSGFREMFKTMSKYWWYHKNHLHIVQFRTKILALIIDYSTRPSGTFLKQSYYLRNFYHFHENLCVSLVFMEVTWTAVIFKTLSEDMQIKYRRVTSGGRSPQPFFEHWKKVP